MHTPFQEAVAQLLFWGSIAGFPGSIACFVIAFRIHSRVLSFALFVIGGALLTQACWYFVYLGVALSDKVGGAQYPVWWRFAFFGFGVSLLLLVCSEYIRACRTRET